MLSSPDAPGDPNVSEDRDRRRPRTPPVGVRAQTAAPLGNDQTWDDDVTPLPDDPRLAMARVDRRVKITGQAALDRFDLMRTEVAGNVRDLHLRVEVLSSRLAQVAESTAAVVGKLDVIMADRAVDRQETSVIHVETARAELEIRRSTKLAEVSENKARSAHRRQIMMRALAGVGAVWATVSTLLLARGC